MSKHQRDGNRFSLLFIDLDGFKRVNDVHGHQAGDQLLKEISKRFKSSVRNEDTVARMGGDEFVAILQNIDAEGTERVCIKLLLEASTPVSLANAEVQISASIGAALYPDDATTINELLTKSDDFMYLAKEKGKNQIVMGHQVQSRD